MASPSSAPHPVPVVPGSNGQRRFAVECPKLVMAVAVSAAVGFTASQADAATLTVCGSGCNYTTIQAAINAASAGDTISIGAGTSTENVVVNQSVTLQGAGAGATIILPATSSPNPCGDSLCNGAASSVILVQATNVTITGLTV